MFTKLVTIEVPIGEQAKTSDLLDAAFGRYVHCMYTATTAVFFVRCTDHQKERILKTLLAAKIEIKWN